MVTFTVPTGWKVNITDGLLTFLGIDDGIGGVWLDRGVYTGDRQIHFAPIKTLCHLEQTNVSQNSFNGVPSTLLTTIGLGCLAFGDAYTIGVEHSEFKRLQNGILSELKVTIRDDTGNVLNNHGLPIHIALEIIA